MDFKILHDTDNRWKEDAVLDHVIRDSHVSWEEVPESRDTYWTLTLVVVVIVTATCLLGIFVHICWNRSRGKRFPQVPLDQTNYSLFKHGSDVTVLQNKYIKSKSPVDFVVPHISYPLGNVEETRVQLLTPGEKRKRRYQHYGTQPMLLEKQSPKRPLASFLGAPTLFGSTKTLDEIGKDKRTQHLTSPLAHPSYIRRSTGDLSATNASGTEARRSSLTMIHTPTRQLLIQPSTPQSTFDNTPSPSSTILGSQQRSNSMQRQISVDEFDLEYYRDTHGDDGNGLTSPHSRGRLCFLVDLQPPYDYLMITIIQACDLSSILDRTPDTRIKVYMERDTELCYYTSVSRNTCNPIWEESFTFETKGLNKKERVVLSLQEYDRFCHQVEVGVVNMELNLIRKLTVNESHKKVWRDILPRNAVSMCRGEVLLQLLYNPDLSTVKCTLMEARNIIPNINEPAFIFAVMVLYQHDKALCRRRSQLSAYEPSGIVFADETYTLDVKMADVFDVSVAITLHCRDWNGASRVLGKVNCGSLAYASGDGSLCWIAMVNEPQSDVQQWLSLSG